MNDMEETLQKIAELLDSNDSQDRALGKEMLALFREKTIVPDRIDNCVKWVTAYTRRKNPILVRIDPDKYIVAMGRVKLNIEDVIWLGI